jgi:acetylornithine/N-succinyldiaminopimelate aminotransferase
LLIAFDLPAQKGKEVVGECLKQGLIINSPQPAMIRLMPPLIVTTKEIDAMLEILSAVLTEVLC